MARGCLTLEALLQSWQHFVLILFLSYMASAIWASVLASRVSDPAFHVLPATSQVRTLIVSDAVVAWMAFVFTLSLCVTLYFMGRTFKLHLVLFLCSLVGFFSHLTLLGLIARSFVPEKRKQILVAFFDAIGRDSLPEITQWKAAEHCVDVVGCSQAAVRFLDRRTLQGFWGDAGSLAIIITTLVAIGLVVLLMSFIRPAEDERIGDEEICEPLSTFAEP
jgi:hypothetical protein